MWYAAGDKDVAALGKLMNQELNGRGGGKNPMIQGSVQAEERMIRKFLKNFIDMFLSK